MRFVVSQASVIPRHFYQLLQKPGCLYAAALTYFSRFYLFSFFCCTFSCKDALSFAIHLLYLYSIFLTPETMRFHIKTGWTHRPAHFAAKETARIISSSGPYVCISVQSLYLPIRYLISAPLEILPSTFICPFTNSLSAETIPVAMLYRLSMFALIMTSAPL